MPAVSYTLTSRVYVLRDEPNDQLPVRRLQTDGGETLAVSDLVQIALGKIDGFDNILHDYGVHYLTTFHSVTDIMEGLSLDYIQATKLLAILTIGKRLYAKNEGSLVHIRGIEDVYQYCRAMAYLAKEHLRILLINSRYQLIHEETISIGGTESLNIAAKDVFQAAVERRVSAVILVHNHPSGDPTPSQSDYLFTEDMQKAANLLGIELLDHVIIGLDRYNSCLHSSSSGQ